MIRAYDRTRIFNDDTSLSREIFFFFFFNIVYRNINRIIPMKRLRKIDVYLARILFHGA